MKTIIAVGGGIKETTHYSVAAGSIDNEIVRLSGKINPKLLFIPTASSDSPGYISDVKNHFGKKFGCNVDVLCLVQKKPSKKEIEEKILNSDIIYVGGGNTLKMMRIWRGLGVDKILKRAYERGIVLAGVSAGAICWFDSGHSNSLFYYNQKNWKYINVKGMGLVKGIFCPHYDGAVGAAKRSEHFSQMIKKTGGMGLAVDNLCAIEVIDDKYKVLSSAPEASAYRVYKKRGRVVSEKIKVTDGMLPISELYRR